MTESCCNPGPNKEGLTGYEVLEREMLTAKLGECGNLSRLSRHLGWTIPTTRKLLRKYDLWSQSAKDKANHETPTEPVKSGPVSGQAEAVENPPDQVG